VSSRPEARWASSSAHRPGAVSPQGGPAPAVRRVTLQLGELTARGVGRWRRKPHARESNASRVHGSHVGCRCRKEASCYGNPPAPKGDGRGCDERSAAAAS
jgi:hypothetical protein